MIDVLSDKRGILSLYNGKKYIIYSQFYGIVAESEEIQRHYDSDNCEASVSITFTICEWIGYWDLKSIIKRGITKLERQYIEDKAVNIEFKTAEGQQMHLNKRLNYSVEDY